MESTIFVIALANPPLPLLLPDPLPTLPPPLVVAPLVELPLPSPEPQLSALPPPQEPELPPPRSTPPPDSTSPFSQNCLPKGPMG